MMVRQYFFYGLLGLVAMCLVSCANPINQATYVRYMDIGQYRMAAGDMVEAEKAFSRALVNAKSGQLPPEDKMITLLRLGEVTQFQGKYDEAANYLEQSLPFAEEAYGIDGGPTGEMLLALAIVYLDQGEVNKGIDLLPRIESIYLKKVKSETITTDSDRFKLSSKWVFTSYARELSKLGRTTEAESLKLLAAGISIDYVDLGKRASNSGFWGLGLPFTHKPYKTYHPSSIRE